MDEPQEEELANTTHFHYAHYTNLQEGVDDGDDYGITTQVDEISINGEENGSGASVALEILEESIATSAETIKSLATELRERISRSEAMLLEKLRTLGGDLKNKIGKNGQDLPDDPSVINHVAYGGDAQDLEAFKIKATLSEMTTKQQREEPLLKVNFFADPCSQQYLKDFENLGDLEIQDCNIDEGLSAWGVTCTYNEDIIVVDCQRNLVQKFSTDGKLIDHIQISQQPRDVTTSGRNEVAITILTKFIFFVGTSSTMRLRRKLKTEKQYDSISMSRIMDKLLVSCMEDGSVDVLDPEGMLLQSFDVNGSGHPMFIEPRYVSFARDGNFLITDVAQGCINGLSQEGQLLFQYQPGGSHVLRRPQGLCVDNIGNIFVVDYSNSRIHLLTSDGHFQRFILESESGLYRPVAIHITKNNRLVIVQSDGMVKLFTYE